MDNDEPNVGHLFVRIDDEAELTIPEFTAALDRRALELATAGFLTHPSRTELAAICHLRAHGRITGRQLLELTAKSVHLDAALAHKPDQEFIQEPVFGVQPGVWANLGRLVLGEDVTFEPFPLPDDPGRLTVTVYEAQQAWRERQRDLMRGWFKTVMTDLEQALRQESLYDFETVDDLPAELVRALEADIVRKHFDGLYGIGAALHSQPSASASGLGRAIGVQGVWVADALARAILRTIAELEAADATNQEERDALKLHINLWWGLLKGYAYSAVHHHFGQSLPGMLASDPDVVERICAALESGLTTINREGRGVERHGEVEGWSDGHGELAQRIALTYTSKLVTELKNAVEAERRAMEALRNIR